MQDVLQAKKRIQESVQWIHKAIDVNPQAHFGREIWQVVLEEFLLAVLDNPDLLLRYDMVGNNLERRFEDFVGRGRPFDEGQWLRVAYFDNHALPMLAEEAGQYLKNPGSKVDTAKFRNVITTVGAEMGWKEAVKTSHQNPVAFDEPTLGIVGMWRMGAGANPHFALALGDIMMRVGQRRIAWAAFERASRLKDGFWPDPRIREKFAQYCRDLQQSMRIETERSGALGSVDQFDRDLSIGQSYQKAYQEFEAKKLANGASIDDPHFYGDFESSHGPIASKVGKEEMVFEEVKTVYSWAWAIFLPGLFAFLAALMQKVFARAGT